MGSEGRAALGSSMASSVRVVGIFRLHCSGVGDGRVDWFGFEERFDANRRQAHSGGGKHTYPRPRPQAVAHRVCPRGTHGAAGPHAGAGTRTEVVRQGGRARERGLGYSGGVRSIRVTRELSVAASSPVSTDRIRDLLRSRDVRFGDYNEGELAYLTPNAAFFWNATNPQILQLRAQWRGIARTPEQFGELAREVAACNSTRTGPKAYLAPLEDGSQYGLIAECNVVVMSGLTQAQLDNFFETSMSMIMGFFADLELTLPGFVDWDSQGREASL